MSREIVTDLIVLGGQAWAELKSQIQIVKTDIVEATGPNKAVFEAGFFKLGQKKARFYLTSQGPSVQRELSEPKMGLNKTKELIHQAFGEFIAENRSS